MKFLGLKYTVMSTMATILMVVLLLTPLHAFLTVWGSSLIGHYTALRLWEEVLLLVCILGAIYLVIVDQKIRSQTLTRRLVRLILLYIFVVLLWGAVAYAQHNVTAKALGYGLIVDLRFPIFFLISWVIAARTSRLHNSWQKLVLWPAVVVIVFGLLQILVLPHDFLSHFGYGPKTIASYETINHNSRYIRIMSTLRGADPLGAYLLVPLSVLAVLLANKWRQWKLLILFLVGLIVLYFSFSRGAWAGLVLSLLVICLLDRRLKNYRNKLLLIGSAVIVVIAVVGFSLRHNSYIQNIVLHTQSHSAVTTTSDQGHVSALRGGIHDIIHQPLGHGPGTAGPASVYNNNKARIAEDFYIQIGQEMGWLGLALFLLINIGVGYLLWLRRSEPLALALFASFVGLIAVNLLTHAWADDTLAFVWWGLAGIALAPKVNNHVSAEK
jgi:O-antigen ligase/polysaccharide polymerase Wzy-like membrane protein